MNAYKCDRCGKFYDKLDAKKRVTIKGKFTPMYFRLGSSNIEAAWMDLCPDCMNALVSWFYAIHKAQGEDIPINIPTEADTPTDTPTGG